MENEPNLDALLSQADAALAATDPNPPQPPISGEGNNFIPSGSPDQPTPAPDGGARIRVTRDVPENPNATVVGASGGATLPTASPDPDAQAKYLDQLDQNAEAAMKESGLTSYVPPIATAVKTPDGQNKLMQAVQDFGAGFNLELGKALSLPTEVIDKGMALLGFDYMQYGHPTQNTIDAMHRLGIPAYQVENMANKLGQDALPALATWAAIQASAPMLAAQSGTTAFQLVSKEIGDWALKHPVLGLWLGQTSSAGGDVADQVSGPGPLTHMTGELVGGAMGSGLARMGAKAVNNFATQAVGKGVNALSNSLPTAIRNAVQKYNPLYQPPAPGPAEGLVLSNKDLENYALHDVQHFAEDQVAGLKMRMDDAVSRAVSSVPTWGPTTVQQRVMHMNLQEAEKISNRIVQAVWARTPMSKRIPVSGLFRDIVTFRNSLKDTPSVTPTQKIKEGLRMTGQIRDPNTGRIMSPLPTIRRLRDYVSSLRNEVVREQASDAPRDAYVRNLNRLAELVEDHIENMLPKDTTIAQARAASRMHHDMFSRGPIADILAKKYRGDFRIDPSGSVDALMDREGGIQAVRDMVKGLSVNKLTTSDEKRILKAIQTDIEGSIRSNWRDIADQDPAKAVKYNARIQSSIKAIANVAGELQLASQKVGTALEVKDGIEKSALARFAATSADKAIKNIFAQKNPADVVRQLIRNFNGDPDALHGLRSGIVQELLARGKNDPLNVRALINTPHIGDMLREALDPSQFSRLQHIVNDSIRLTSGEDKGFLRANFLRFTLLGRIIGAQVGRFVSRHAGGGTIQVPGIFARIGAKQAERIFGATSPQDMLRMAVIDPEWEKMLYSRFPQTTKEMRIAAKHYRRLYAAMDTARNELGKKLPSFDDAMPQP